MFLKKNEVALSKAQRAQMEEKDGNAVQRRTPKSTFLSCVVDVKKGRDVATVNIPSALMQADTDKLVRMKVEGKIDGQTAGQDKAQAAPEVCSD